MMKNTLKDNEKRIKRYFTTTLDYWQNLYDGNTFTNLHMADRKKIVLDLVRQISAGKNLNILDLGCGTGILTLSLIEEGHYVVSLDCSEQMVFKLKEALKDHNTESFQGAVIGTATQTPFCSEYFDVIICIGVFQYQLNDDDLLKEISRILKKNSFCVFTLPNLMQINHIFDPFYYFCFAAQTGKKILSNLTDRNLGNSKAMGGEMNNLSVYSKKYFLWQLNKSIDKYGMKIRDVIGFGYGPFTFWRRPIASDPRSVKISNKLNQLSITFPLLKYFSNRWVYLVEKL